MKLSVVVPCFNEEAVLPETLRRLDEALQGKEFEVEFVFVNDGSRDATASLLNQAADADPRSKVLHFSRNFGHQSAVTAGIHEATGDYAAIIDADLQDPPELIPVMLETAQREKCNVVYAVRNKRKGGESPFKLLTAWLFYRVLNFLSEEKFPENTGDFRLVDRKVMEAFKSLPKGTGTSEDCSTGSGSGKCLSPTTATNGLLAKPNTPGQDGPAGSERSLFLFEKAPGTVDPRGLSRHPGQSGFGALGVLAFSFCHPPIGSRLGFDLDRHPVLGRGPTVLGGHSRGIPGAGHGRGEAAAGLHCRRKEKLPLAAPPATESLLAGQIPRPTFFPRWRDPMYNDGSEAHRGQA